MNEVALQFGFQGVGIIFPYLYILSTIRAAQGRPYNWIFGGIDIISYIYISCLPIRATQGRPYIVLLGFIGIVSIAGMVACWQIKDLKRRDLFQT